MSNVHATHGQLFNIGVLASLHGLTDETLAKLIRRVGAESGDVKATTFDQAYALIEILLGLNKPEAA